jgi:uncharacterized membrane protein YkgB
VLAWIGAMKFAAYEAMGIQPLVSRSPLVGWMYHFLSTPSFSTMLGFIEIGTAALMALRSLSPKASAVGSVLANRTLRNDPLLFLFDSRGGNPASVATPLCLHFPVSSCSRTLCTWALQFGRS